jgi:ADP-heptose:LPS heptosyltransferase
MPARPVIVHAGSGATALAAAKRWPPEHCSRLLRELRKRTARPVILVEGPDEAGLADDIMRCGQVPGVFIIRLRGSLGTSAALLQRAALYIGSDSGLAHLAAAVGTPPVALFGPADPERMCPFGYRHLVVQARTATCRACNSYPWKSRRPKIICDRGYACMRDITADDILEKALPVVRDADRLESQRTVHAH